MNQSEIWTASQADLKRRLADPESGHCERDMIRRELARRTAHRGSTGETRTFATYAEALRFVMHEGEMNRLWQIGA